MKSLKNIHWFPHPANLRNDRRMKRAMKDLPGGVGYGAIVLVIEVLRCEPDFKYPLKDIDLLAAELAISLPILQTVIKSYGFFVTTEDEHGQMFVSPLLNELMIPYIQKQKQNQIAGQISAKKRKLKQEQQLHILSQLRSSEHTLNDCLIDVAQNKIEKKRKDNNRKSLFTGFKPFKQFVLSKYQGKIVCYGPADFSVNTAISVTKQQYLKNNFTGRDLSIEDAYNVWGWMFENQDKLCNFEEI